MSLSKSETAVKTSGAQPAAASRSGRISRLTALENPLAVYRRGPRSFLNLSLYAAGLSGLWTALSTPILPIKVEEVLGVNGTTILGYTFDADDKNGALGIVSLVGLAIAAIAQVISGTLSDRRSGPGKRMPFLLVGSLGMAGSLIFLDVVGTLVALIFLNLLIQGMGNVAQGAANGLIADHVSRGSRGAAAGALNLSRVLGAGIMAGIVLLMMGYYDAEDAPGWMTGSLVLMAVVAAAASLWTVTAIWRYRPSEKDAKKPVDIRPAPTSEPIITSPLPSENYLRFLVALTIVITGFSALQLYSFFYLEDVIGLENPARGGFVILMSIVFATALTVLPAGKIADRIGRDPMIFIGGGFGVLATLILIFANSLIVVALVGLLIGSAIGIFLTVAWALANDLVSTGHAARDLGYASIAVFVGSTLSRLSGLGIDWLNQTQEHLGYQVILAVVSLCFIIAVAMMTRLGPVSSHTPGNPS